MSLTSSCPWHVLCGLWANRHASAVLKVVGAAVITSRLVGLASFLVKHCTNVFALDIKRRYAKAGSWAVVTGGSEGIGFALANELASRGLDVAIIALDEPRLTEAAASIAAKHRVRTLAVPFNFWTASDGDHAALQRRLEAEVESQGGMAVLVNNVGVFYRYAMPFDAADLSDDLRMLKLNCEPQVRMTKWAVPILKRKGCGAIVTTSSISAVLPAPYLSVYSGTKSFNRGFAQSLEAELLGTGVDTLIITPHVVNTRMAESVPKEKRRGTLMVDPEPLARDAISKLGVLTETAGHRFHCIVRAVFLALRSDRMKRTAVSRVKESYERCRQLDEERRSQTAASK